MFWGLIMEPQRRYTQQVKKAFHVSMAALDVSTSSDEPAQVMCGFEGRNYLLCTLKKPDMVQCPLDLNFEVGSELSFAANGKGHVHLTGYLIEEPLEEGEEEKDEEEEADHAEEEQEVKSQKRNRKRQENGSQAKKAKASSSNKQDSDSDGSDIDVKALLEKSFGDSDDDDSFNSDVEQDAEEEEDEEDDNEEEVDEAEEEGSGEESSANEEDSDEDVEVSSKKNSKVQVNGIMKESSSPKQKKEKKNQRKKEEKTTNKEGQIPKKRVLQGGVMVEDLKEGHGAPAKSGKFVTVYYEGRLKQNNKLFDATTKGAGFSFRLGSSEVIKGWDVGVQGMKIGGKRKITCPPNMAYGQKGSPPAIPANSTLVFEVELKKVR